MRFLNYVIQDRSTKENLALFMSDGVFGWEVTSLPAQLEPILKDSITGFNYIFFIEDGISGQEQTSTGDTGCILYDAVQNVYWKLYFTDGIFTQDLTIPPAEEFGGAKGFAPIEHYYRFLMNAYNLDLAWTAVGKKQIPKRVRLSATGKKRKKNTYLGKLKGYKKLPKEFKVSSIGKRQFAKEQNLTGKGNRLLSRDYLMEAGGIKVVRHKKYLIESTGKRDLTPLLEALDLL